MSGRAGIVSVVIGLGCGVVAGAYAAQNHDVRLRLIDHLQFLDCFPLKDNVFVRGSACCCHAWSAMDYATVWFASLVSGLSSRASRGRIEW